MASPELSCVYAALILNDDGIEITADKLNSLLNAAGVKVESYWVDLFAEYFKNHDISELIKGTSLGGAPAAGAPAGGDAGAAPAEEKKEEKKEEEEVEMAGGFDDLFG
ncbi:60S acidic ribosomal protein P1 [Tritrichomonas musculus]|uniref:60S acidic ribosomal protein P1 n=1 Tax=Tritrichomonas musculus TaxID=1915356 RepID=A0ABR2K7G2_9EUKA